MPNEGMSLRYVFKGEVLSSGIEAALLLLLFLCGCFTIPHFYLLFYFVCGIKSFILYYLANCLLIKRLNHSSHYRRFILTIVEL